MIRVSLPRRIFNMGRKGGRGERGHARITTYPARQGITRSVLRFERRIRGILCAAGREYGRVRARTRGPRWTREVYREADNPLQLVCAYTPPPPRSKNHIDADNYAARALFPPAGVGRLPPSLVEGFRGFPNCEIGRIAIVAPLYRAQVNG